MSRDRTLEDTFFLAFTTRAFATGIPTTLSGTPVVSAYEDAGLTEITAGITLGVDHDSRTGLNMLTIVATAANGYESGKDYNLVITTGTVGGVSVVSEVIGQFSLSLSAAAVDLANGTDGLGAIKTDTAAILIDTAEIGAAGAGLTNINLPNQTMDITGNITGNLSGSVGSVTGAVGSVTGNVGGNVIGSVASVTGTVGSVIAGVTVTTNNDKTGYSISGSITTLDGLNNISTAQVNTEVLDVLTVDTFAELSAVPAATSTIVDKLNWLFAVGRNKITQTATTQLVRNDADAGTIGTSTVSDDGTTFIREEYT